MHNKSCDWYQRASLIWFSSTKTLESVSIRDEYFYNNELYSPIVCPFIVLVLYYLRFYIDYRALKFLKLFLNAALFVSLWKLNYTVMKARFSETRWIIKNWVINFYAKCNERYIRLRSLFNTRSWIEES